MARCHPVHGGRGQWWKSIFYNISAVISQLPKSKGKIKLIRHYDFLSILLMEVVKIVRRLSNFRGPLNKNSVYATNLIPVSLGKWQILIKDMRRDGLYKYFVPKSRIDDHIVLFSGGFSQTSFVFRSLCLRQKKTMFFCSFLLSKKWRHCVRIVSKIN